MTPRDPINFVWVTVAAVVCLAVMWAASWWRNRR